MHAAPLHSFTLIDTHTHTRTDAHAQTHRRTRIHAHSLFRANICTQWTTAEVAWTTHLSLLVNAKAFDMAVRGNALRTRRALDSLNLHLGQVWSGKKAKRKERKGREGKEREEKGKEGKGREGKGAQWMDVWLACR